MIAEILERHRDELAFLYRQRAAAVHAPHVDLRVLADLDERVEAHLDGLRVAGDAGHDAVAEIDASEPGVAFAAAALAIEGAQIERLSKVIAVAEDEPEVARAVVAAFAWSPEDRALAVAATLSSASATPLARALAVAAWAAHRRDPGGLLANAILDPAPILRARALRAAGQLGRADLLSELVRALADTDEACRFWAAWSAAILGAPEAARVLWSFVEPAGPWSARAVVMAVRRTDPREALGHLESLAAREEHARTALLGAGALGDPGAVTWLLAKMDEPATARLAGDAFTMITGIAIDGELAGRAPEGFHAGPNDDPSDDVVAMDPDADRLWPSAREVAAAFKSRGAELRRGQRYLLGQAMTEGALTAALRSAKQPVREAAAIERSLLAPGRVVFEVRAPAWRQKVG